VSTKPPSSQAAPGGEADLARVRDYIVENFLFGEGGKLGETTSFLNTGILDSTGILSLVAFLEASFGIAVKDDELVPENLDSLRNIGRFLARKRGRAA